MANEQYVQKHYEKVAKNFGLLPTSSMQDPFIRELEIEFVLAQLYNFTHKYGRFPRLLDVGCGNGYLLSVLAEFFPEMELTGLEYSPDLFKLCQQRKLPGINFIHGDMRKASDFSEKFDMVITERSLINLLSTKQQNQAIKNIAHCLAPGGHYLMIESFKMPLHNLNIARAQNGLSEIFPSKHNKYLSEGITGKLKGIGLNEVYGELPKDSLSTHFFLSRVFHPITRNSTTKNKYSMLNHFFDEALPLGVGQFSPILFRVFEKELS
ncbi:MAG: class I SAM-dependent methyltransferase [Bacteriovoracaceae bacterium]|jgi:SAM-dependent methyltransferase|nr:class I SAM-dependent methyltransferase [Bacteriovoracaceae bacterium]